MASCSCVTQYYLDVVLFRYAWRLSNRSNILDVLKGYTDWKTNLQAYYNTLQIDCKSNSSASSKDWKVQYIIKECSSDPDPLLKPPPSSGLIDSEEEDFGDSPHTGPFFPPPKQLTPKCNCVKTPTPPESGDVQNKISGTQIPPIDGVIREEKRVPVTFKFTCNIYRKYTNCKDPSQTYDNFFKEETYSVGPIDLWYEKVEYKWNNFWRLTYNHKCP